jgi:hypothetical protein
MSNHKKICRYPAGSEMMHTRFFFGYEKTPTTAATGSESICRWSPGGGSVRAPPWWGQFEEHIKASYTGQFVICNLDFMYLDGLKTSVLLTYIYEDDRGPTLDAHGTDRIPMTRSIQGLTHSCKGQEKPQLQAMLLNLSFLQVLDCNSSAHPGSHDTTPQSNQLPYTMYDRSSKTVSKTPANANQVFATHAPQIAVGSILSPTVPTKH